MLRKRIIVCLDVRDGRVVKGVRFVDLRDMGDPVELAARYEAEGADEIVFLDISASAEGRRTLLDVVRRTAERLFVPLTVGGGIREVDDIAAVLRAGADKVSINTAAVRRPSLLAEAAGRFGAQCVVASVDAAVGPAAAAGDAPMPAAAPDDPPTFAATPDDPPAPAAAPDDPPTHAATPDLPRYRVFTHGGRTPTDLDAIEWTARCAAGGAGEILLTSIDRDGSRDGFDLDLTGRVARAVTVPVIASGGAGEARHFRDAFVAAGADAALAAGIFHDGTTTIRAVKRALAEAGVAVRLPAEVPT